MSTQKFMMNVHCIVIVAKRNNPGVHRLGTWKLGHITKWIENWPAGRGVVINYIMQLGNDFIKNYLLQNRKMYRNSRLGVGGDGGIRR